jgi:L-aspartate oxidase
VSTGVVSAATIRRLPVLPPTWERQGDVVVVGAGAAGLSAALAASAGGRRVLLLCKGALGAGATALAQGGLAAVLEDDDSVELHEADTLTAGAGLCDPAPVHDLVASAPAELRRLRALGAVLDADSRRTHGLALTREGGHSRDRVVHAGGDASGAEVDRTLVAALRRSTVEVLEHVVALDALLDAAGTVVGVTAARVAPDGQLEPGVVRAGAVVLATGGIGQAWETTTNPAGATGDGLALALRAGAELRDVEFVQFHPTVLWLGPAARGWQPLVTEAVRGEGAVLVDATGRPVMTGAHPLGDLAPRDVVTATMHRRMSESPGGVSSHLLLDATALGRDVLERRFPTVLAACRAAGIDPVTQPVPVAPGAHYSCGGVSADLRGRTSVAGLFAVGEVAATGVHGANRLASNSVTEALVAGRRAGELLAARLPSGGPAVPLTAGRAVDPDARAATASATSRDAGVLRGAEGLTRLLEHLADVPADVRHRLALEHVEATALHTVSSLVALAALTREESRGCHRRTDAPTSRAQWKHHLTMQMVGDQVRVDTAAQTAA